MTDKDPREVGTPDDKPQGSAVDPAHAFQLIMLHEATREQWLAWNDPEPPVDPEHARKLAAVRTELLARRARQEKRQK